MTKKKKKNTRQTNKTLRAAQFLVSQSIWVGLHILVIRKHSSESIASDMTLYQAQYKHTKFG